MLLPGGQALKQCYSYFLHTKGRFGGWVKAHIVLPRISHSCQMAKDYSTVQVQVLNGVFHHPQCEEPCSRAWSDQSLCMLHFDVLILRDWMTV